MGKFSKQSVLTISNSVHYIWKNFEAANGAIDLTASMIRNNNSFTTNVESFASIFYTLYSFQEEWTAVGNPLPLGRVESTFCKAAIGSWGIHTSLISHGILFHECALPCQTLESIHLPGSVCISLPYLRMKIGSDIPISFPTCTK